MSWSPDFEIVVFATGNNTLLMMTKEWDVLIETEFQNSGSSVVISWRGDGAVFACNSPDKQGKSLIIPNTCCRQFTDINMGSCLHSVL